MFDMNPDQQDVICEYAGPRSVVAGPGSGKTTTMVTLIRELINKHGVSPSDIRAVTFSKEMATAMENKLRIKGVASTFHSLGYLICSETERKPVEPELRHRLMCKLSRKWGLDYKELDRFIARMREAAISPAQAADRGEFGYGMTSAYAEYEKERHAAGWMDFSSMLADAVALLENPDVRRRWSPKFLIVDEAQDTSDAQWRMMQLMAEKHGNITVVGDSNQCIYGFRGAKPDNITDFQRWFPAGRKYYLGKNYRCHPPGVLVTCAMKPPERRTHQIHTDVPVESLTPASRAVSWDRRSWRFVRKGQNTVTTEQQYDGLLLTICAGPHSVPVTPNHKLLVRWTDFTTIGNIVYLMWREDLGFRVGQCSFSNTYGGKKRNTVRLWHRIHLQKPDKIWILAYVQDRQDAARWENIISAKYGISQLEFEPSGRHSRLTKSDTEFIFSRIPREGGLNCLVDYRLLFDCPLFAKKSNIANGYFLTAACNVATGVMAVPTRENPAGEPIFRIETNRYKGPVYSLDVENDHTYIANGIIVGNSTQTIVRFVRENAPEDTPKELLERMTAARSEKGVPIGLKMYWSDDAEAESALALAQRDPLNSIILARTNRMVGLLERLCNRHNVRYHLMGKTGFWKQNEIRKAVEALNQYPLISMEAGFNLTMPGIRAKYAVDDRTERDNDALENLEVLKVIGKDFKMAKDFVVYANKMMHRRNDPKGVTISTVHQAKGGEWKNVFLIGANAKGFPHPKGDPKEEKRIYFVAISRPMDMLRISFSGTPSPYLRRYLTDEILVKLREHAEEVDKLQAQTKLF